MPFITFCQPDIQNEDLKGGLNDYYRKDTDPVAACTVTTELPEILLFTHKEHHGAIYTVERRHIILRK